MSKLILLLLKIFSAVIVCAAGILGIVGGSTDERGLLTEYGKASLLTLLIALVVGGIIIIIEYYIERKGEKKEESRIRDDLKRQLNILKDIQRSIYSIDSFDFLIDIKLDIRKEKRLRKYRKELERFISLYLENSETAAKEFDLDATKVIMNRDETPPHPIAYITFNKSSPFYPSKDYNANYTLSPMYSILITDHIDFSKLDEMVEEYPYAVQHLYKLCDLELFVATEFDDDSTRVNYYPGENYIYISTLINDVEICHDNGKIASVLDLDGKYLVIFSDIFLSFNERYKLSDWRIQFNKSENKHYNSMITIEKDKFIYLEGKGWAAYAYKINLEPSKVPVIKM